MARRQCLRLITVDETTVSSSRSSSSSRLLLLHCFAYVSPSLRYIALLLLLFSFCQFSLPLSLAASRSSRDVLNILPSWLSFFFRILLISFYFVLRARDLPFSLRRRLLASSSFFGIPVVFFVFFASLSSSAPDVPILLPRTPCLIVLLFFCYHTRSIREYCREGRCAPVWTQRSAS